MISRALLGISVRSVAATPASAVMWWEEQPSFPELCEASQVDLHLYWLATPYLVSQTSFMTGRLTGSSCNTQVNRSLSSSVYSILRRGMTSSF
jgi:hypothetical protein